MKEWYGTNWGVVSEYDAIAIGKGSASIAKLFPSLKEASESQIDNYTLDELKQYKLVVLSGFTYKDETAAENLLLSLSRAGVRVVISADGIPEERGQKDEPFLGLTCNEINFSQGYPILDTVNGEIDTYLFPKDHRQWATVFIEGLDEVRGSVRDPNYLLPFYGTVDNENLVVIGLNLIYYYSLTQDIGVRNLLSEAMNISPFDLPKRSICPLQTEYSNGKITIRSEADNINTTLAFHDMFTSDRPIISENNLLYVNSGTTEISFDMSKMIAGAFCTAVSLILMIVQSFNLYGLSDKRKDKGDLKE